MLDAVMRSKAVTVVLAVADRSSAFPPLRILRRRAERSTVTLLGVREKLNTHKFSVTKVLRCFEI